MNEPSFRRRSQEEVDVLVKEIVGYLATVVRCVERYLQQAGELLQQFAFQCQIGVQVHTLLIHTPGILVAFVFQHHGAVKTDSVVHAAFPGGSFQCSVGSTVFAHAIAVVVALLVPPFVIGEQLRIHLGNKGGVTRMGEYFIDSPAYQGRLAVTGIVLGGIGVDTVDNHAVRLLVVEHGSDVVLGQFGVEFGGSGTEAPAIPCPKADEIAYGMARDDAFVKQSTAVCPPIGDERGDGFHGDAVIFGLHVLAQYLGEVTFPTFGIGLQGGGGIIEQARQVLQAGSHLFFGSEERDSYVDGGSAESGRGLYSYCQSWPALH